MKALPILFALTILVVAGCSSSEPSVASSSDPIKSSSGSVPPSGVPVTHPPAATKQAAVATTSSEPAAIKVTAPLPTHPGFKPAPASTPATATHIPSSGPSLVGAWKAKLDIPKRKSNDPAAKMAEGFGKMMGSMIELEFASETAGKMKMMGIPVDGRVTRTGNSFVFMPEKVMGMTPAELRKAGGPQSQMTDMKPLKGSISADGRTLTLHSDKGQDTKFTRKPAGGAVGKSTVNPAERALVGHWRVEKMDVGDVPEQQKQMVQAMLKTSSLDLRADNTFTLNLMVELKGKWTASGGKIHLNMTGAMGMSRASMNSSGADLLTVSADGRTLTMKGKAGEKGGVTFTKA